MKIIQRLLLNTLILSFTLLITSESYSQCDLSNLSVNPSDCNEEDLVDLTIDFDFSDEGSQGFTILGNGTNYGNFQYISLPIILNGIEANCDTEYEFIIRDVQDPTCSVFTEFGTICCDDACLIEIIETNALDCNDGTFSLIVEVNNASIGVFVNVFINETIVSQIELDGMQFVLDDISVDEAGLNNITICSVLDPECCTTDSFLNPCECSISQITTEIIDCNEMDSSYYAVFDFEYASTADSFQMGYTEGGNSNFLGVFAYADLPITAGPIFWSDNEREILIADKGDFFCFSPAFFGVVNDCDINCQIFNVFAESYECENGQYFIDVEFDSEDIEGNSFDVIIDDVNYGSFVYGENFYTVGPINQNCDSAPVLIIQDSNLESCKDFFNFDEPICCGIFCEFTSFEASATCNDANEVIITFEYSNPSTTENNQIFLSFEGNVFGPYFGPSGTGELSIPAPIDGAYSLTIYVDGNSMCSATTILTIECIEDPECTISGVFAEAQECLDGSFLVDIEFNASEVSDSFEIRGNGQSYGIFAYGQTFYTVGPLLGDCELIYEFVIIDQEINACQSAFVFDEPICCASCEFSEMEISLIDCTEEEYTISLDFDYEDNGESFTLTYLGETYPYNYSELPIEISSLPIGTEIEIIATSNNDESCSTTGISFLESCLDALTEDNLSLLYVVQTSAHLTIKNPTSFDFYIMLSSIRGEVITQGSVTSNSEISIQKDHLFNGLYIISFINNGQINSKKIIILDSRN